MGGWTGGKDTERGSLSRLHWQGLSCVLLLHDSNGVRTSPYLSGWVGEVWSVVMILLVHDIVGVSLSSEHNARLNENTRRIMVAEELVDEIHILARRSTPLV